MDILRLAVGNSLTFLKLVVAHWWQLKVDWNCFDVGTEQVFFFFKKKSGPCTPIYYAVLEHNPWATPLVTSMLH